MMNFEFNFLGLALHVVKLKLDYSVFMVYAVCVSYLKPIVHSSLN